MRNSTIVSCTLLVGFAVSSCASHGSLATRSGRPEIVVAKSYERLAPIVITSYNISRGRELDLASRDELVTYEGVRAASGDVQVTRKVVYQMIPEGDSLRIVSTSLATNDLDDDNATEEADQPSLELQQQELKEIASILNRKIAANEENANVATQDDHSR